MAVDAGVVKNVVQGVGGPLHFGPDMLPDRSMRKKMSRWMCWAAALVEVQAPPSSTLAPPPPSKSTNIPPAPPMPPFPEDALVLVPVVCCSGSVLQPHHAAAMEARVSDTKTG